MKILQIITELTPAGAERVVCELSKALHTQGHIVEVVSLMPKPENQQIVNELEENDITVHFLSITKTSLLNVLSLRKIINTFKPDIIHSHLIHANILSRLILPFCSGRPKLVNTIHIAEQRKGCWWHFLSDKWTLSLCDIQTAVSHEAAKHHSAKIGVNVSEIPVILNGVPVLGDFSLQEREKLLSEFNMSQCSKILGSIGRLRFQKGYDILLSQLHNLSSIIPSGETWGIIIIGEGPEKEAIENLIKSSPDNIKIALPGFYNDAQKFCSLFDVFLMPSRYEGHPLTLLEAMTTGIPIIASKAPTIIEASKSYNAIKYIEFENFEELKTAISVMLDIKRRVPFHECTIEKMVSEYLRVYKNVLGE